MAVQVTLSGLRKAAILILTLGEEPSAKVMKHMRDDEIELIAREIAQLGDVATEVGERVLDEFDKMATAAEYTNQGGVEYARRVLDRVE